jgi:integrase
VSCDPWFAKWLGDRLAHAYTTTDDSAGHFRKYIAVSMADKHINDWTAADLRKLCRDLDALVIAGKIAWKTAFNVWGTATRMCDDACGSKIEELRVRADNPATGVRGPDRGASKAKQFLYPSEALAFMLCAEVPLLWRRLLAVAIYCYVRAAELRALDSSDVDFEHDVIHVHSARNRRTAGFTATKGMQNRRVPIEPALKPLLVAMHAETGGKGLLFPVYPMARHSARGLRVWLKKSRGEACRTLPQQPHLQAHDAPRRAREGHHLACHPR